MINIYDLMLDVFTFGIWGAVKTHRRIDEESKKMDAEMNRILQESQHIKRRIRKAEQEWEEGSIGNMYK